MSAKTPIKSPKKLIEVALPIDTINEHSAIEKSNPFLKGHPRSLHQWWARRPLPSARAVIFAQLVNDPGFQHGSGFRYGKNKKEAAVERKRLFGILEDLVKWENTNNEKVLRAARNEIHRSWREVCDLNRDHPQAAELFNPNEVPDLLDPFAGGGAIPLEAQRLGLVARASDLNPVAVVVNRAMIQIPPLFTGLGPVNPESRPGAALTSWSGARGLAEDVRHYAGWVRSEAEKRIGHLYPKYVVTSALASNRSDLQGLVGKELPVLAFLWARTVRSPSPAFSNVAVPLASTFVLSSKAGKETWIEPVVDGGSYRFEVRNGKAPDSAKAGTKAGGRGAEFLCAVSGTPISGDYIKEEGRLGRLGQRMMAVVVDGPRSRIYLPPTPELEEVALRAEPAWKPDVEFFQDALGFRVGNYGMTKWCDLFTARQIVALTTFSDLIGEVRSRVMHDAVAAGQADPDVGLQAGGRGAAAYSDAVAVYLALANDKMADYHTTLSTWNPTNQNVGHLFTRQVVPITWDFPEASPLHGGLAFDAVSASICAAIEQLPAIGQGFATQADAAAPQVDSRRYVICCDPPYYDNIGYADLSDFFYVWMRRSLRAIYPDLFTTIAVPKAEELVATPGRHGSKAKAEAFFLRGMSEAMAHLAERSHPALPIAIYYAFKQSETKGDLGTSSSGWETFLEAVLRAGLMIVGTWPVRTEREARSRGIGSNALASSIVLVCRRRSDGVTTASRREFIRELNVVLPDALDEMTRGIGDERSPLAPVDLSQAIIGPGMAVFSKYPSVLEADGSPMSVKTALQLINRFLAEDDFDHDTQFCLHWFEKCGWGEGAYGEADVLARAKATGINGLADAGVLKSGAGKVRLLRPNEYPSDWDPRKDPRIPIWEMLHQLIRALRDEGESGAGKLLAELKPKSEAIRQLGYRLYTLCERKGQADDARAYNELVTSWSAVESAAGAFPEPGKQFNLFGGNE